MSKRVYSGSLRMVLLLTAAATLSCATVVHAQTDDDADTEKRLQQLEKTVREINKDTRKLEVAEEDRTKAKPWGGWNLKDGFFLQSTDGAYKLKIGGYVQNDGRFFIDNEDDKTKSQFTVRRARLDIRGTLAQYFEFRLLPDFAGGKMVLQDAYVDAKYIPEAFVRVGKLKQPVGLERLQSATSLLFIERALPTQLVPNRDLGVFLMGDIARSVFSYQLGIADGVPDGKSNDNDTDLNSDKDFVGRVFGQPLLNSSVEALRGLGFGISGTYGRQQSNVSSPDMPTYKTSGQATFFQYRSDSPATGAGTTVADGAHYRYSPQAYYYFGPFGFLTEYVASTQRVLRGPDSKEITNTAWQIRASYVLTGENDSFKGLVPAADFNPFRGTWGAWQVAARYSHLNVDNDAFSDGFADPAKSATSADEWAIGLNWYLNPNVLWALNFDRTTFHGGDGTGNRDPENLLVTRVQFLF